MNYLVKLTENGPRVELTTEQVKRLHHELGGLLLEEERTARQSGRTTRQMRATKRNGLYIVPRGMLPYARKLAYHIDRGDLRLTSADNLDERHRLSGIEWSDISLDHACELTEQQRFVLRELRARIFSNHKQ